MNITKSYATYLKNSNLSESTIRSYMWTINYFNNNYDSFTKNNLLAYKEYLTLNYKPKTVNLRIQAINKYLSFMGNEHLQIKAVKIHKKTFLENVIGTADYTYLKECLKKDGYTEWYFVVWYLAATGARVSELVQIKIEHVKTGYLDLYTKGGKIRRLYIPSSLQRETLNWIDTLNLPQASGYLFVNHFGNKISTRGIANRLKHFAQKYGLNPDVVYPHSFRHMFAKNFLDNHNDLSLLADLMGHESIETTRIYLRRTSSEQQTLINTVVTW